MRTEFELDLYDDDETKHKLDFLGTLEAAFDDKRNNLPASYYWFAEKIPLGSRIRVIFEMISNGGEQENQQ